MTTASLNGNDVYYELSGAGPKLLFLNGTGATLANTAPLVTFLSGDFEVAAFDQRGLGRSLLPDDGYTMADLAAIAAVLNGVSVWTSATFSTYHGVAWSVPGWGSFSLWSYARAIRKTTKRFGISNDWPRRVNLVSFRFE